VAEASTIGLPPGRWPNVIRVVDDSNVGFLYFREQASRDGAGNVVGVNYRTRSGAKLLIIND
jgi:hypothetical protein